MIFYKLVVNGNDFVAIDNRHADCHWDESLLKRMAAYKWGVGADGVLILQKSSYDFAVLYFNRDGGRANMCGNGAIASVHLMHLFDPQDSYQFNVWDTLYQAQIEGDKISLQMQAVKLVRKIDETSYLLDTGVPHLILLIESDQCVSKDEMIQLRKKYDANVSTFLLDELYLKTYERGVENFTLSCGSGVMASAYLYSKIKNKRGWFSIRTDGGSYLVNLDDRPILQAKAELLFKGEFFVSQ